MKEIDKIYESLLFSIPQNNLGMEYKYGFQHGITLFKKAIENSTVFSGQMRKTGKWNFIGNQMFECSECGTCYTQSQFYQMRVRISDTEFPKFCPNCGADMRGEQDDESRSKSNAQTDTRARGMGTTDKSSGI